MADSNIMWHEVRAVAVNDERVEAQVSVRAVVRGRVQGVGFRDFVQRSARALGLCGTVRNGEDGRSVEVWAYGPRPALDHLLQRLYEGPRFANVAAVEVDWSTTLIHWGKFEVVY